MKGVPSGTHFFESKIANESSWEPASGVSYPAFVSSLCKSRETLSNVESQGFLLWSLGEMSPETVLRKTSREKTTETPP